jgi:uncharacterized protein
MTPRPAVIDTNIVVSGILTRVGVSPTARILDGMLTGRFRFLLSIELLAEYREVLLRPKIRQRHGLSDAEVDVILTDLAANGVTVEIERPAAERSRRGDDHLWELLAAVPPAFLVTGDQRLINKPANRSQVMTARAFAELLGD